MTMKYVCVYMYFGAYKIQNILSIHMHLCVEKCNCSLYIHKHINISISIDIYVSHIFWYRN